MLLKGEDGKSIFIEEVELSTDDAGLNIIHFSDGTTITVMNGSIGPKGE
jgi:hypothetical protein